MSGKTRAKKLKPLPMFATDAAAEKFVGRADLSQFDLSRAVRFEFDRKSAQINLRMPEGLLKSVKLHAKRRGIPYQRFIREILEHALR